MIKHRVLHYRGCDSTLSILGHNVCTKYGNFQDQGLNQIQGNQIFTHYKQLVDIEDKHLKTRQY